MVHKSGNYSFREPPFKEGDTVTGGNYMQLAPGTDICAGMKNLTITGGNFVNCAKQPTWDVKGGNWCQVSRCSHKHPEWVAKGLPKCVADCQHRSAAPEVVELSYEEVSQRKKNAEPLPGYISQKVLNKDDVDVLKYTVTEYVYRDKVLK